MKKTILCLAVIGLVGCSTTKVAEVKIPDGVKTVEQTKPEKVQFPEWYTELPKEDNAIYAAATEVSSDLQFCIDKATMSAKREIAFKLNNEISQKYKEYTTEGHGNSEQMTKETERMIVANSNFVNLVGVQRVKSDIVKDGNKYRAYVLVRYGLDESNKIHSNYMSKTRKQDAKQELKNYERELREEKNSHKADTPDTKAGNVQPVSSVPQDQLLGPKVADANVRQQAIEAYNKPNAVVIKETIQ